MRVAEHDLKTAVYLCQDRLNEDGIQTRVPIATGFFVATIDVLPLDTPIPVNMNTAYIVTARHVVEEASGLLYVRWNTADSYEDVESSTTDWFISDEADVAVIRAQRPNLEPQVTVSVLHPSSFITADYQYLGFPFNQDSSSLKTFPANGEPPTVGIGDEVFFVGLFSPNPGKLMNRPVARFGKIARMPSEPLVLDRNRAETFDQYAYLVETVSWGGHSGSPAFWRQPWTMRHDVESVPGGYWDEPRFAHGLLGLVSAHYDIATAGETTGDILGSIRTPLNSGMAVVTPSEYIRRLLMRDDVKEDRKKQSAKMMKEFAPTMDTTPAATTDLPEGGDEFSRFEQLTQTLVNTPKNDVERPSTDVS